MTDHPGPAVDTEGVVMRGRHAIGPEIAGRVTDSPEAAHRLRVILETIAGTTRVQDACTELGICEQRFERLRQAAMRSAAAALVAKPAGRRRTVATPADAEVARLRGRIAELEAELQATAIRAHLAAELPGRAGKKP
jgi:hypothetical protein